MSRRFILVAVFGFLFAGAGLWLDAGRVELAVHDALVELHHQDQLPAMRGCDSVYFIDYARQLLETGHLRARWTQLDNAPYGRENIGWAAPTMWHLAIIGKIWSVVTGMPIHDALMVSSQWANPILYFIVLAGILVVGWRTKTFPSAAVAVLILGTSPRGYFDFGFAAPDHHGWHELTTFGTVVCLAAAVRRADRKYWFTLAGFFAASAMWVGATEQAVLVAAAGTGALAGMLLYGIESRFAKKAPAAGGSAEVLLPPAACWRLFGTTAAVFSLLFYIFEFAPNLFRMRLEVNHPVFSLAFLVGGEFLYRVQRMIFPSREERPAAGDLPALIGCALVLAAISGACLFGPTNWHVLHLSYIQRYHKVVIECMPIIRTQGWWTVEFIGAPVVLVLCGTALVLRGRLAIADRMALLICVTPTAAAIGASFFQYRWAGLAGAAGAGLGAFLFSKRTGTAPAAHDAAGGAAERSMVLQSKTWSAICILAPVILVSLWCSQRIGDITDSVSSEAIDQLASEEIATALRKDADAIHRPPVVVFLGQYNRQSWIAYVHGIPSVGSLYWDNPTGLLDQLTFLTGYDEEAAHKIARERGITHVVLAASSVSINSFLFILHGTWTSPDIHKTLAWRLAAPLPKPPAWIQLLPTTTPAMKTEGMRIYRVTP